MVSVTLLSPSGPERRDDARTARASVSGHNRSPMSELSPPSRLLCGPGPTNAEPAVLEAMQLPILGHMDPDLQDILLEVVDLLGRAYGASGELVLPLQSTGTSGMETGIASLVDPGDVVIIGVNGYFGARMVEIAERWGAEVVRVDADWGEHVPNERLLGALDDHPGARLVAIVHAETSTGVEHPLAELGAQLSGRDTLLMADCVTSLGGVELRVGDWGVDYAYSCTQKCLGSAPGMSPIAVSERALQRFDARRTTLPFTFDLRLLERYWVNRPATYHHTVPVPQVYALHAALTGVVEEGLEARWERHRAAAARFAQRIGAGGLELLADPEHRLAPLSAVRVPEGADGAAVQRELLSEHGIEVGGGLGPAAPPIWRVGLMGHNANEATADRVAGALLEVLGRTSSN